MSFSHVKISCFRTKANLVFIYQFLYYTTLYPEMAINITSFFWRGGRGRKGRGICMCDYRLLIGQYYLAIIRYVTG